MGSASRPPPITQWRDGFLTAGEASLSSRPKDGEEFESERLKARLGGMLLERELLEAKIAILENGRCQWASWAEIAD